MAGNFDHLFVDKAGNATLPFAAFAQPKTCPVQSQADLVAVRLASPLTRLDLDDVDGLPLFDAERSPKMI